MSESPVLRPQALSEVYELLRNKHWVAVVAPRFSGKSEFARGLKERVTASHPAWRIALVEFQDVATLEEAWQQIVAAVGINRTGGVPGSAAFDLVASLRDLVQANTGNILCLLLNRLDSLPDEVLSLLASELRRFHGERNSKGLRDHLRITVFGASKVELLTRPPYSPLADVLERIELPDFNREETGILAAEILGRPSLPPDVLETLYEETAGY